MGAGMNARPISHPSPHSRRRVRGWFASALLVVVVAAPAGVRGVSAGSASPPPEATPTPTPVETPAATPTPEVSPIPAPEHSLLEASVVASAYFGCDPRSREGGCITDVDERGLTFTAAFDGARVIAMPDIGFALWLVELPGTAFQIGPGGSVRVVLTAAPQDVFRVVDVDCIRAADPFEPERGIPSTLQGNTVSFEFEVAPLEMNPTYDCRFVFDPATVPRFPPTPRVSPPPTDTTGASAPRSDHLGRLALAILVGLVAGVPFLASHKHSSPGRIERVVSGESGTSSDS